MQSEGLRPKWWHRARRALAVPLAFAAMLTQLALVPGALPAAGANHAAGHFDVIADDTGSLRDAIADANAMPGSTVSIPPGTYNLGSGGELAITADGTTIIGTGTRASEVVIAGPGSGGNDRVIDVAASGVEITGILVTGGNLKGRGRGGGIQVQSGASLVLVGVQIDANRAYEGGGLYNDGIVTVSQSTVSNNTSGQKGGGIKNDGVLTMVNSTVSGNKGKGGGGLSTAGTANLAFSTVFDNTSTNKIGAGTLRNGGSLTVINSIVANNRGSDDDFHDCSGSPDMSNVIVTSDQGCNPDGPLYVAPSVPGLADEILRDNGGMTETHALVPNSPAIDGSGIAGLDLAVACLDTNSTRVLHDQRALARPVSGTDCDIGAYEIDQAPPTVSAVPDPDGAGGWVTSDVTVTITATDTSAVAATSYSIDGGAAVHTPGAVAVAMITGEGTTNIEYWAVDTDTNESIHGFLAVMIDKTLPTTTATANPVPVNGYRPPTGSNVSLAAADAVSGIDEIFYSFDGGTTSTSTTSNPATVPITATATLTYWAVDVAGNEGIQVSVQVDIDSTVPTVTITPSPSEPASGWYTEPVTVTITTADAESGPIPASIQYQAGGGVESYTAPFTLSNNTQVVVTSTAADGVGNVGSASPVTIRIDRTPPSISNLTVTSIDQGAAGSFLFSCPEVGSGLDSCTGEITSVAGIPEATAFASLDAIPTGIAGIVLYEITGVDVAGNSATSQFSVRVVDLLPPILTADFLPVAVGGWNKDPVEMTLTAVDNTDGLGVDEVLYKVDGGADQTYGSTVTFSVDGEFDVEYWATDLENPPNTSPVGLTMLKIDQVAPTVESVKNDLGEGVYQVVLTPADVGSGPALTEYSFDTGETWTIYVAPFQVSEVGTTEITVRVTDVAGNVTIEPVLVTVVIAPLGIAVDLSTSADPVEVGAVTVPIGNIQQAILDAQPEGSSTSSTPLSAIPLSAIPLSAIPLSAIPLSAIDIDAVPLSAIPLSAIPLSAIPLSAIPLSAIPLSAIPLSAIPLSAIDLSGTPLSAIPLSAILLSELQTQNGDSIEDLLAGTDLAATPILSLNFTDLVSVPLSAIDYAVSPLSAIPLSAIPLSAIATVVDCTAYDCEPGGDTLADVAAGDFLAGSQLGDVIGMDDISFGATPLSAIPLSAIALGTLPLSAIPLSAIDAGGDEVTGLDALCVLLGADICTALEIDPSTGAGGDYTIMTLALAGVPLSAIPLSAIPLSAIPLSAIFWESTPLSAIPLSAIPLSAIDPGASPLSAIPLSAIPLSAIGDIVDCSLIDCATATLGEAADAGAILATADLGTLGPIPRPGDHWRPRRHRFR